MKTKHDRGVKKADPAMKIFSHPHLDWNCVEHGCQSLLLKEARKLLVECRRSLNYYAVGKDLPNGQDPIVPRIETFLQLIP